MNAPTTPDPVEIAMEAEASGAAPQGLAQDVLRGQSALFRWQIANERAGFVLRVLLGAAGVAVAVALGVMGWQASRADGLVVEAFSTPPDLAAKGLTGQVVASQVLDRFNAMQLESHSIRPLKGSANAWTETAKMQIPETGVSIGELQRMLRGWLGHERHVSGEVFRTADGLQLTVRLGSEAETVAGPEADLAQLFQAGAERLYRHTDPTRYAQFLESREQKPEALALFSQYVRSPDPDERAYALEGVARFVGLEQGLALNLEAARISKYVAGTALLNGAQAAGGLGRAELELELTRRGQVSLGALKGNPEREVILRSGQTRGAQAVGDFSAAYRFWMDGPNTRPMWRQRAHLTRASMLAGLHDPTAARASLGQGDKRSPQIEAMVAAAAGDWATAAAVLQAFQASDEAIIRPAEALEPFRGRGLLGEALAHLGRFDEARAAVRPTPMDCYRCLRARGTVEALAGRPGEADRWYAAAVRIGPSLPQAETEWARALLARGDAAGAVAKAEASARKGPRFADAYEVWGEALLAKGDAKGAAAKLSEAVKLTPAWALARAKLAEAQAKVMR